MSQHVHEYFDSKSTSWSILGFLEECIERQVLLFLLEMYVGNSGVTGKNLLERLLANPALDPPEAGDLLGCLMFWWDWNLAWNLLDSQFDFKLARKWERECSRKQVYYHRSTITDINGNVTGNVGTITGGSFIVGQKRNRDEEQMIPKKARDVDSIALIDEVTSGEASTTNLPRVVTLPSPNNVTPNPSSSHDSLQAQSESDDDYFDSLCENDVPSEIQNLIIKMADVNHRLFEYRIVNLAEKNLVDPVNKVFSDYDKKKLRRLWEE
ncbi:8234_t:CDS:2 [Acaulospora morrowiae]|uniref:8234_t:CDS:1 n=1 Tax=Acaulospora morrowiae TaxID=94023 RepID=A0A9N9B633_9GLOM|nr:8234_t:CDS:2 [Acaulospora morrowiae]